MKAKSQELTALMYMEFGNLLLEFDCNEDASRFLSKAMAAFEKAGNTHGVRRALQSLGKVLMRQGSYGMAEKFYSQCLEMREETNPGYDIFPLIGLLETYRFTGQYDKARETAARIEESLHHNEVMKPYVYAAVAGLSIDTGKYRDALEMINRAIDEHDGETRGEIWIEMMSRRAWCYFQLGETWKAIEGFEFALKLAEDKEVPYRESAIHSFMAVAKMESGSLEDATTHAQLAVDKAAAANSELSLSLASEAMGRVLNGAGDFDEGMKFLKRSLSISRRGRQKQDLCAALISMARNHLESGNYREAMMCAYRVYFYSDRNHAPLRNEAMLVMAHAYAGKGLMEEAISLAKPVLKWSEDSEIAHMADEARELVERVS